jgi:hypothetical protein
VTPNVNFNVRTELPPVIGLAQLEALRAMVDAREVRRREDEEGCRVRLELSAGVKGEGRKVHHCATYGRPGDQERAP